MSRAPILAIDFDGVLHSYASGWKGARNIPDPPVEGAIEWLNALVPDIDPFGCPIIKPPFRIAIFSTRCRHWGGARAIENWLLKHGFPKDKLDRIDFPWFKPAAFLFIDDRAWTFLGKFPTMEQLKGFKPWNKR
jgi:hypothetical protein